MKPRIHIKIGHGDAHVCSPSALEVEMDESWSARASQASQSVSPSFNQKPCLKIQGGEKESKVPNIVL